MMQRWLIVAMALTLGTPLRADPQQQVRALYEAFVAAQNRHDIAAVRPLLSDRPDFLWISDGQPVWGREAMLSRMASFQQAEVWKVIPEYGASQVIVLDEDSAVFHVPLLLILGTAQAPAELPWLVEVVCQKEGGAWKIAGLYTAQDKR